MSANPKPAAKPAAACYATAADLLPGLRADIEADAKPILYPVGSPDFASVEVGPGRVVLIGGQPGAEKTTLVLQWVVDALRLTKDLKAVVLNVEMRPQALLTKELARFTTEGPYR